MPKGNGAQNTTPIVTGKFIEGEQEVGGEELPGRIKKPRTKQFSYLLSQYCP